MTIAKQGKAVLSWLGIALLCTFGEAHASTPLEDYFKDTWSTQDCLPHNSINAITQTSDGYLWFATWETDLLRLADQALYRTKEQGRNRVEIWQE